MDKATFLEEYWEKRPLILARGDPEYYQSLLSLGQVDSLLARSGLRPREVRVVQADRPRPLSSLPDAPASLEALYERYREGATVVLQFLQERWPPLTRLCRTLAAEVSAAFQVNAYLTPRGAQGLRPHYDTHDVFVLQVEGSKHWRLFECAMRLPLPGQPFDPEGVATGTPSAEFDLHAGDLLYLPRGFVHEAATQADTSLHLTVGVHPITWAEVLLAALERTIRQESTLRESLPHGFARDPEVARHAAKRLGELLDLLKAQMLSRATIQYAINRAWSSVQPDLDGHLLDLEHEREITLATPVRRRQVVGPLLEIDGEDVVLHFHGKELRLPGYTWPEVNFIVGSPGAITAAELPGDLDNAGRLVLIRRLVREGLLSTVTAETRRERGK
jgi:ribosomal protein L16 Arg81 hydroxylase